MDEWIGHVVEQAGHVVTLQAWDFRPGTNFVLQMQTAASNTDKTILVLSPDYLESQFAASEWAAAFRADPRDKVGRSCRSWFGRASRMGFWDRSSTPKSMTGRGRGARGCLERPRRQASQASQATRLSGP
ncbi:hypothetical protein AJ87_07495 [Rhizobium yanglingense]|nr:hypothetical protein AJ87_07495 [Rhizobium yanglingense]